MVFHLIKIAFYACLSKYSLHRHIFIRWKKFNENFGALVYFKVYKHTLRIFLLASFFGIAMMGLSVNVLTAQNCSPGTTTLNIDLTASPTASWNTSNAVGASGQCCSAPANHNCMELNFTLHPDANGVSIVFSTPTTNLYYTINCGPTQYVSSNIVNLCFEPGDVGPHSVTFCKNGSSTHEFSVFSFENDVNVTLEPFDPVCEGSSGFLLNGGSPGGGGYFIDGIAGSYFNVSVLGPDDYEITYVYTDETSNCISFASQTLTVVALPEITWTVEEFCNNEGMVPLNGALISGVPTPGGIYSDSANFVSNNHFNTDLAIPGTYPIDYYYADSYGCSSTAEIPVIINETPIADAGPDQSINTGNFANLTGAAIGTGTFSYSWAPAGLLVNPNVQNPQTIPLTTSTIFTLTVTNTVTGCSSTDEMAVIVSGGSLHISAIRSTPPAICVGSSAELWVLPGGGSGNYTYSWTAVPPDASLVSTQASPVVSPGETTTYTVEIRDALNLASPPANASVVVTVNLLPVVTINMPPSVCANTPNYSVSGGSPAGGVYSLLDAFGNVLSLPNINLFNFLPHDIGEGSFQVMYEYTDPVTGCWNSVVQPLTILPYVQAQFYASRDDICISNEVTLSNHSIDADQYFWQYGDLTFDNESASNFIHTFPEIPIIKTYTIRLTASNVENCSSIQERKVTVYPPIVSDFSASDSIGCSSLEVDFTSLSTGPIRYHFWDFGDGTFSVEKNPSKVFTNNSDQDTTFTVILTIQSTNSFCMETDSMEITVYPAIKAGFTATPAFGCDSLEVEIGNLATGALFYEWDFGNGLTDTVPDPPNQIYRNFTDSIVQYTITQIVRNNNCSDTITHVLDVYPEINAAFSASDTIGCSPLEVTFTNLSSVTATLFEWDFGDGGTSSNKDTVHVFENNTNASITYTVWLRTRTENHCWDSVSVDITVHPFLKADFDFTPTEACNPHIVTINNKAYGAMDFLWTMDDGTTYTYNADSLHFNHLFDHNQPDPVIYNVQLLVTNAQGCRDSLIRPMTIFPKIDAAFIPSVLEGCSPMEVFFSNNSTGATQYRWEFGDGGSSTLDSLAHTFTNTSFSSDTIFDVWLFAESPYGCRDSLLTPLTVYPRVKADFTVPDADGCSPFFVSINNYSQGADSLYWNFGDGDYSIDTLDLLTHVFENKTNAVVVYQIELIATNQRGCTDTLTRNITVYPEVNINYSHPLEGCHPFDVAFVDSTENANYYDWNFADGVTSGAVNPTHEFLNFSHDSITIFSVTLYASSIYGCWAEDSSEVLVYPKPLSSFNITNSPGCSPHEIVITHDSRGASSFDWDFGDGNGYIVNSFDSIVSHLYNHDPGSGPATFDISLITENYFLSTISGNDFICMDTLVQSAVIYPNITAEFEANITDGCHPLTIDFTNRSTGADEINGIPTESAYFWNYGNGNTSGNKQETHSHTFFNHSHLNDTLYTVVLTAYNANNCLHQDTIQIRVLPAPKALFSIPNPSGCAPHDVIINNTSSGVLHFNWDMGDGDTLTTSDTQFTHSYHQPADQGPGQFMLNLHVENHFNCVDTHSQQILVYPEVVPLFATQNEGCHPHVATFENTSLGGDIYSWDFGNGNTSQAQDPLQTFINYSHTESQPYDVTLTVESTWGCSAQLTQEIIARPVPKPLFQLLPFTGCSPFSPEISNLSIGANTFQWDFGNGDSNTGDSIFVHTWNNTSDNPMQYPVTLSVMNEYGCEASEMQTTTVFPEVTANFTTEDGSFEGCSPLTLRFNSTSVLADSYSWDFADSTISSGAAPLHVFENSTIDNQIFPVQLLARSIYGCSDTVIRDVTVFPSPEAYFTAQPIKQPYPNTTITLNNGTNPGYWNFHWEFGDGNYTQTTSFDPLNHFYTWDETDMSTKDYVVALVVSNDHCSDIYTQIITITSPVPKAEFSSLTSGCVPFTVQFSNHSMYAHSFRWEFGDGSVSTDPAPEHIFVDPGSYEVIMVAIGDGGRDTTYHQVEVIENPTALFQLESPLLNIPEEPLRLINNSLLADFYLWDFGDGNTSYEFEPEYYYTETGVYDISLIATRNSQPLCHDTLVLNNVLRVDQTCKIVFPDAFIPSTSGSTGGGFDMNNPSTSIFHPVYEGVENYVLEIYTRWGELIFRSEDINVGWDGYHKGRLAQMDVYVWKVTGQCFNGKSIIQQGNVTLYR
jgi:PKD repeat protein